MKRIVGCADVRKVGSVTDAKADIHVVDAGIYVRLSSTSDYPVDLTVEEARHVADALLTAASRVAVIAGKK